MLNSLGVVEKVENLSKNCDFRIVLRTYPTIASVESAILGVTQEFSVGGSAFILFSISFLSSFDRFSIFRESDFTSRKQILFKKEDAY